MTDISELVSAIRRQNWKNGGALVMDNDEAEALVEQALSAATKRADDAERHTETRDIWIVDQGLWDKFVNEVRDVSATASDIRTKLAAAEQRAATAEARVKTLEIVPPGDACCCRFGEDGETLLQECAVHAAVRSALQEALAREARKDAALTFYRDAWDFKTNKRYGGLEWHPKEELLDDCGECARQALSTSAKPSDTAEQRAAIEKEKGDA